METLKLIGKRIAGLAIIAFVPAIYAQPAGRPAAMIHESVNEAKRVPLEGNVRPEATPRNDRGRVADTFQLDHMVLQLKRSPERESALKQYIDDLHNPQSPNFHQWLTPDRFAQYYGVAKSDVDTVTGWLKSHGFTVHGVQPSGMAVDFSGTAGMVRAAYQTEIHTLEVDGVQHFANMTDPKIPTALQPVVTGVVSLHNFRPHPLLVTKGQYTEGSGRHALVAGDIQTIYNFKPLYAKGYSGQGQTIMVLEDTYLYSTKDWSDFRTAFGLTSAYPSATLSQVSPQGSVTCKNPGFQGKPTDPGYGDDSEAAIDVEWASAAAPSAAIVLAACTDTSTTFGGLIALQNVLNGPAKNLPSVVSISYGEAEAYNGAAANAAYNSAYQQAASEGVSIFVSSGDEGAASADITNPSTHGIGISGLTSTPYNVSVGGTDFGYTADGVAPGSYWSSTNNAQYSSALSYIQEVGWTDSCAGGLLSNYLGYTRVALCNSNSVTDPKGQNHSLLNAIGGSGGPSGCATGTPSTPGLVSGTCAGYKKPIWQSVPGNPSDGVRDIPDVSLFASNGFWDAYYVACWSNPNKAVGGGFTCTGAPSAWSGFGGTSVSSPIMAALQALVNQKTGSTWGNPNYEYYSLAATEYGPGGIGAGDGCNSNRVNKTDTPCIFYDVTQGDNDVVCLASSNVLNNCFLPSGNTYGYLSTSNTDADNAAYHTEQSWDFVSGIGSVNAYNLVMNWPQQK